MSPSGCVQCTSSRTSSQSYTRTPRTSDRCRRHPPNQVSRGSADLSSSFSGSLIPDPPSSSSLQLARLCSSPQRTMCSRSRSDLRQVCSGLFLPEMSGCFADDLHPHLRPCCTAAHRLHTVWRRLTRTAGGSGSRQGTALPLPSPALRTPFLINAFFLIRV